MASRSFYRRKFSHFQRHYVATGTLVYTTVKRYESMINGSNSIEVSSLEDFLFFSLLYPRHEDLSYGATDLCIG